MRLNLKCSVVLMDGKRLQKSIVGQCPGLSSTRKAAVQVYILGHCIMGGKRLTVSLLGACKVQAPSFAFGSNHFNLLKLVLCMLTLAFSLSATFSKVYLSKNPAE